LLPLFLHSLKATFSFDGILYERYLFHPTTILLAFSFCPLKIHTHFSRFYYNVSKLIPFLTSTELICTFALLYLYFIDICFYFLSA
jgi:hypothetical protein